MSQPDPRLLAALNEIEHKIQVVRGILEQSVPERAAAGDETFEPANDGVEDAYASDQWPEATNEFLITPPNDPAEQQVRGTQIVDLLIDEDLTGLSFLDYGCGSGFSPAAAKSRGCVTAVGYDLREHELWKQAGEGDVMLTNDFEKVKSNGPYDVVVCFDVLDHADGGVTPEAMLEQICAVTKPGGTVLVRTHPGTSRHAHHNYYKSNRAYSHLVLTDEELNRTVPGWGDRSAGWEPNVGVTRPLMTYEGWFRRAKLEIVSFREINARPEEFFRTPKIAQRIQQKANYDHFPEFQLSIQFVDYVLKKPE